MCEHVIWVCHLKTPKLPAMRMIAMSPCTSNLLATTKPHTVQRRQYPCRRLYFSLVLAGKGSKSSNASVSSPPAVAGGMLGSAPNAKNPGRARSSRPPEPGVGRHFSFKYPAIAPTTAPIGKQMPSSCRNCVCKIHTHDHLVKDVHMATHGAHRVCACVMRTYS